MTIKKAGKFELLTEAWTPKKGDVLRVMKRADGKFIEVSRATAAADSYQFPTDATTPQRSGRDRVHHSGQHQGDRNHRLTDAVAGVVYTIHGAGAANASTIANGGNFVLTAAMTLNAGAFIQLVKAADGKFYEVARG